MQPDSMRRVRVATISFLLIELLDELVYGAQGAAMPAIRGDLNLSYEQIGLLLSVPTLVGSVIEPALGILGDVWQRRVLIVGGGLAFALALLLIASGTAFLPLLAGFVLFFPASGAFVSLSQATLMDQNPERHEQWMARWTLSGAIGVLGGSLLTGLALAALWGWRPLYALFALFALLLVASLLSQKQWPAQAREEREGFRGGLLAALQALRNPQILRWLILLDLANLLGDVLLELTALYFNDVVHVSEVEAALAVTVLTGAGLAGSVLIVPLLERVRGLAYLRWSALAGLALYGAMLLIPDISAKVVLLAGVGLCASGWYTVLRGQLYTAMPGRSGTSVALSSIAGIAGGLIPAALGFIAGSFGLPWAMALLALGPISLLVGLPRVRKVIP